MISSGTFQATGLALLLLLSACQPAPEVSRHTASTAAEWVAALEAAADTLNKLGPGDSSTREQAVRAVELYRQLEVSFSLQSDWMLQDGFDDPLWTRSPAGGREHWHHQTRLIGPDLVELLRDRSPDRWMRMTDRVLSQLTDAPPELDRRREEFMQQILAGTARSADLAALYLKAAEERREQRLAPLLESYPEGLVFARHFNMGSSHYAYTEGLSDAQYPGDRVFQPGSSIKQLRMNGTRASVQTLLDDPDGVIRDIDVSYDGRTLLFAWKQSLLEDDYSLYTMDLSTRQITPITEGLGYADYEPAFLPDGTILFNSTRCVQIVDCWLVEVSNLYTADADGSYMRRVTFDQVHNNYPSVMDDGRVIYTRWEYNDRGQDFTQGLFQMNPDGTSQREYYGNNSWFPTTILHARGIPGSQKVLAVFTGHHTWQAGKLGVLDPSLGRQENEGAQLVAPVRETPLEIIDFYGQEGDLFMYPWPIDEHHFLVSYSPRGWEGGGGQRGDYDTAFGLYFMDMDGHRELLYRDDEHRVSVGRMVPLTPRPVPHTRPSLVDHTSDTGVFFVQDVYEGPGLEGVPRGEVTHLRVIALDYRPAWVGSGNNHGPAGNAVVSTPVSRFGSWDVKTVLGRAQVHPDGSAMFEVPARTPVYFQALDKDGHMIQSMRSWSTLQPGEQLSCVGCHTTKNLDAPRLQVSPAAMQAGVQTLEPVYGTPEGFSYLQRVQPIIDQHCGSCHDGSPGSPPPSLASTMHRDEHAGRYWSEAYLSLTGPAERDGYRAPYEGPLRWLHPQSAPGMLPPYYTGAMQSPLITMLDQGHHEVHLSEEERRTLALWVDLAVPYAGDYAEANAWTPEQQAHYEYHMAKRTAMEQFELENIQAFIQRNL